MGMAPQNPTLQFQNRMAFDVSRRPPLLLQPPPPLYPPPPPPPPPISTPPADVPVSGDLQKTDDLQDMTTTALEVLRDQLKAQTEADASPMATVEMEDIKVIEVVPLEARESIEARERGRKRKKNKVSVTVQQQGRRTVEKKPPVAEKSSAPEPVPMEENIEDVKARVLKKYEERLKVEENEEQLKAKLLEKYKKAQQAVGRPFRNVEVSYLFIK